MIKNIHFTLLIRINKQLHEFNFRRRTEELYDGDTSDERGNRYYFKMIKENDAWKMRGSNVPKWIVDSEDQVSEALIKIGKE